MRTPRAVLVAVPFLGLGAIVACVVNTPPPADPTVTTATPSTTNSTISMIDASAPAQDASTATNDTSDASASSSSTDAATATNDTDAGASASTNADGGAAAFQACAMDSDCVAVPKNGCCKNGYKEAVKSGQEDAYKKSFKCPEPKPMCPQYFVNDMREPECNNGTHLCEMVAVDKIQCGGFIKNQHACPSGHHCKLPVGKPDLPGTCVK